MAGSSNSWDRERGFGDPGAPSQLCPQPVPLHPQRYTRAERASQDEEVTTLDSITDENFTNAHIIF